MHNNAGLAPAKVPQADNRYDKVHEEFGESTRFWFIVANELHMTKLGILSKWREELEFAPHKFSAINRTPDLKMAVKA